MTVEVQMITTFMGLTDYLEHTDPLFKELNILKFTKLVIHRIAMLMFKYSLGLVTSFIIIIPGRVDHFTPLWGGVKPSTEHSHSMESIFEIIYQNIYLLM